MPRWCEIHERWECGADTRRGQCHAVGNQPCWRHKKLDDETREALRDGLAVLDHHTDMVQVDAFGVSMNAPVTPRVGIILMLQVSWQRWQKYARLLEQQIDETKGGDTGVKAARGLVGATYDASPAAGGIYPTGEAVRALVEIEERERDRFTRLCAQAHSMGVEDSEWQ